MPTGGSARFFSPVHLNDFVKVINVAAANRAALERLAPATIALARAEGLDGHARAIERRLEPKRIRVARASSAFPGDPSRAQIDADLTGPGAMT